MEASERPQLPIDDAGDGTVRALDDRIVIERLTVTDERAARVVRERAEAGQEAARTVGDAIEIGARVLDREDLSAEVDYVRAEFERASGQMREQFSDRARELTDRLEGELERVFGDEGGAMSRTLDAHADELAEHVARHFDPERQTAVQNQVRELVIKAMQDSREALVRHLSSEDGSNPLADFKSGVNRTVVEAVRVLKDEEKATREKLEQLQREVVRLTEQSEAKRQLARAEERGTRKGRTFEELVHGAIEEIAAAQGDAAHHTGDESSEAGGKKGDTVVEIGGALGTPAATIVFEAKNKKLSKNDAWPELNSCMAERDAGFAVLVVAGDDKIPSGLEDLTEYQGNKMIVVLDYDEPDPLALRLVYRYVRARLLATSGDGLEVDAAGVRDAADEAAARLKRANRVRKSLTSVTNSADAARQEFDEMVADVERCLARIESLVAAAAQEAAE
jgi:hypothetical protein